MLQLGDLMYSLKLYIIKIIVVVAILQIGGLFINIRSFARLYTLAGAIILVITIFSFPDIKLKNYEAGVTGKAVVPVFEDALEKTFENNLADKIMKSVYEDLNLTCEVKIYTDMEQVEIYVFYENNDISPEELSNYIKSVYCTPKDRVVINNERYF